MKTRGVAVLIIVGCLLAGGAGAQMAPETRSPPKAGQAKKAMMSEETMTKCKAMMTEREGMVTHMTAMDATLGQLVAKMRAADPDHKIAAMSAVIEEMVAQRKAMREMSESMTGQMMAHMTGHVRSDPAAAIAECPVMKKMATAAVTSKASDHAAHH